MELSDVAKTIFMVVYTFALVMVCIYGLHRYVLVMLYYRHRNNIPKLKGEFAELPHVTIQLPMYNEQYVARRIIEKTTEINYPREKLQIQVLDDSTDETCLIVRQVVEEVAAKGFDIEYIHRDDRTGFKAGALENGLKTAKGEFISIFDADFIPESDFLKRSIHYFTDPRVCAVQTRWEHLNRGDSLLTGSQAIFLDGHFAIEACARNRSERFMSFNGTAGTWRKLAIACSGGWQHDTLTEDLDLSYRAQLRGWKFVFLRELAAPAELPSEMNAYKAQQFRWTKGGVQTAIKLLPKLLMSREPLKVKVEGFFHLTCFIMHLYMMIMITLMLPAMYLRTTPVEGESIWRICIDLSVFTLATLSTSVFYCAGQRELFGDWRTAAKYMPMMMALGVGLCVSNTKAVLEAFFGKKSEFVRTPKYGSRHLGGMACKPLSPGRKGSILPYLEMFFGVYMAACAVLSVVDIRSIILTPFLVIFTFGFFYVSVSSLLDQRASRRLEKQAIESTVTQSL